MDTDTMSPKDLNDLLMQDEAFKSISRKSLSGTIDQIDNIVETLDFIEKQKNIPPHDLIIYYEKINTLMKPFLLDIKVYLKNKLDQID